MRPDASYETASSEMSILAKVIKPSVSVDKSEDTIQISWETQTSLRISTPEMEWVVSHIHVLSSSDMARKLAQELHNAADILDNQ